MRISAQTRQKIYYASTATCVVSLVALIAFRKSAGIRTRRLLLSAFVISPFNALWFFIVRPALSPDGQGGVHLSSLSGHVSRQLPVLACAKTQEERELAWEVLEGASRQISTADLLIRLEERIQGKSFNHSLEDAQAIASEILRRKAYTAYHGTNSHHAEQIAREGLCHKRDNARLYDLVLRVRPTGADLFGFMRRANQFDAGTVFVTDHPTSAARYARSSPEWFFISGGFHRRSRAQFMGEINSRSAVIQDQALRQEVTAFFEEHWDVYVGTGPVLYAVDLTGIPLNRKRGEAYAEACLQVMQATTVQDVKTILNRVVPKFWDDDWGIERSFSPDRLLAIRGL